MMKRFLLGIGSIGLALGLLVSPAWAFECPSLIQEANEAMAKIKGDEPACQGQSPGGRS